MRVPNAGQDLIERRIVREGKRLAEVMLADYADPPDFSIAGLVRFVIQALDTLRGAAVRF